MSNKVVIRYVCPFIMVKITRLMTRKEWAIIERLTETELISPKPKKK